MPDGDGLTSAVANIDHRMSKIAEAIEAARRQIEQATRAVEAVRRDQAQQQAALNRLNAQLDEAMKETREGIADLKRQIEEVRSTVTGLDDRARSMQLALDMLVAQQLEEKLRRERESEWANFILTLHGMLRGLSDPAVRVVFASDALDAIALRKIRWTSFLGVADKVTVDDILYRIERAGEDVTGPDRTEAEAFFRLRALDHDAAELLEAWDRETSELLDETASAERALEEAQGRVAEKETPESEDGRRRRHALRTAFAILAALIAAAAVAGMVAIDPAFAWILLVALVFAALAWRRSDAHRQGVLAKRREELAAAECSLAELRARAPELDREQRSQLAEIRGRWKGAALDMPAEAEAEEPAPAVAAARPVIARAKKTWEGAHPEIGVLAR